MRNHACTATFDVGPGRLGVVPADVARLAELPTNVADVLASPVSAPAAPRVTPVYVSGRVPTMSAPVVPDPSPRRQ